MALFAPNTSDRKTAKKTERLRKVGQRRAENKVEKAPEIHAFIWKGRNSQGRTIKGEIKAETSIAVKAMLRQQGIAPLSVKRKPQPLFKRSAKIKSRDIAVITRQIATMLHAGVPLVTAIQMIGNGHDNAAMRKLLVSILQELESGTPLSQTLRPHRKYFDDLYCDLIAAGEYSGTLDAVFDRIATYREKSEALKSKIKKAMLYPTAVIATAGLVTSLLLLFVVPQFEDIFSGFGAELPFFTQIVINLSRFLAEHWYYFLAAVVGSIVFFVQSHRKSQHFRDSVDHLILRAPAIGSILHKASIARFARTLATTFAAGVPLIEGLDSASGATGNAMYRNAVQKTKEEVIAGLQVNLAMRTTGKFPDMLVQMVMIGEESGALDDMLNKVANIYEREVDDAVEGLSTLIEPLLMVVIGGIVGGLIVAMYLPIFQLGTVIG